MARKPFMKFFGTDHRADAALRCCGFAARGLWTDLLTLMMEAEPYGHLLISGKPPTARKLAQLLGSNEPEVTRLLAELEDAGVYSRTEEGVIYSRRMVRDGVKAEEGKSWQEYRWAKQRGDAATPPRRTELKVVGGLAVEPEAPDPNRDPNRVPSRGASRDPTTYSQSPESRIPPTPRTAGGGGEEFGSRPPPLWAREMLRTDPATGRLECNGWDWETAKRRVSEAAGLPEDYRASWEPLARWLSGGGAGDVSGRDLDDICAAIAKCAGSQRYTVPASLKYFDRPVASYGTGPGRATASRR
jgi:DNA-binding Lrp family transcriptional regulator